MSFGTRLRERREELGLKQSELGSKLGITGSAIGNYENEVSSPKADILYQVFDVLKCDANYLFQDEMSALETNDLTVSEIKIAKKYRSLDDHGKRIVDFVINEETDRMSKESETQADYDGAEYVEIAKYLTTVSAGSGADILEVRPEFINVAKNIYTEKADFILTIRGSSMEPKFSDNDIILVEEAEEIDIGEIGIFIINELGYVKEYQGDRLLSLNPKYDDIYFDEYDNIRCVGRVVGKLDPNWIEG